MLWTITGLFPLRIMAAASAEGWAKVEEGLYLFQDCVNVYAIVRGENACLVGFATGRAMDHLAEIRVRKVDMILVTHHHRDGLQGIQRAVKAGIPIVIPAEEAPFIESAEKHWAGKRIFVNYEGASRFNAVTFDVPASRRVNEGDAIEWGSEKIQVVAAPGHTMGSVAYAISWNGKKLAFTGDFYTAPGKTLTYHDLDWGYGSRAFPKPLEAADKLLGMTPMRVCPDHNHPFEETGTGLEQFKRNLENASRVLMPNGRKPGDRKPGQAFGPPLVFVGEPVTYAIVSKSAHAIIVDPGYLQEADLRSFMEKYKIQSVDAVTFSHYHDDHVARALETVYTWLGKTGPVKTRIWVFEAMADVIAHPERYNIPCLFPMPIHPDRIIRENEVVRWEGLDLTFKHFPGQTWYHTVILFKTDGQSYALTGDSVWGPRDRSIRINGPIIPRNRYFLDNGFETVFRILLDNDVDAIAPGHYDPFTVTRSDLERSLAWAKSIKPTFSALVDQPDPGYGMDPHWAHFYPYRVTLEPPSPSTTTSTISLLVRNYLDHPAPLEVSLVLPEGVQAKPGKRRLTLPAGRETAVDFELKIRPQAGPRRRVVLADLSFDGRYMGQVAEMVVDDLIALPGDTLK